MAGWGPTEHFLYTFNPLQLPAKLFRVDIDSGKRELMKEFAPADRAGVQRIGSIIVTPELRAYAYDFDRELTDMYVVEGLK